MEHALRDGFGVASMLGDNGGEPKRVEVTNNGAVMVASSGLSFMRSLVLDLSTQREQDEICGISDKVKAITVNIVDAEVELFINSLQPDNRITVVRPMHFESDIECLYVSNLPNAGKLELWLWK